MTPTGPNVQESLRPASPARVEFNSGDVDDLLADTLTLNETAKAARSTVGTICRWMTTGCVGVDGRNHILPSIKVGHRRYTRRTDFAAFLRAINARA